MSLAIEVVAILLPFLTKTGEAVAEKVGDAAWETAEKIYRSLKSRFETHPNTFYPTSFQQFEEDPGAWRETFQATLTKFLQEDDEFTQTLRQLLEENGYKETGSTFFTNVSGNASVGQIVNAETYKGTTTFTQQTSTHQPSSESLPATDLPDDFGVLRQNLATYFNTEEITNLCYDLKIDPQSLPVRTKGEMVLGLVDYCRRYGRIPQLIAKCRQLRPNVDTWGEQNT